eukprot:m.105535 g.105535  ORF g.105535 m.105535 type:complete len:87 (+) comp15120_c0_seq2:30-290(+)
MKETKTKLANTTKKRCKVQSRATQHFIHTFASKKTSPNLCECRGKKAISPCLNKKKAVDMYRTEHHGLAIVNESSNTCSAVELPFR